MSKTIKVAWSDACTDVLVHLAGKPEDCYSTWHGIRDAVAPTDAVDAGGTTWNALNALREAGLVACYTLGDLLQGWQITAEGRAAVREAAAK